MVCMRKKEWNPKTWGGISSSKVEDDVLGVRLDNHWDLHGKEDIDPRI